MNTVVRLFVLILLSMSCASAFAQPTGGCHCFRDRTYNPENKFSSDSYLLTTVFNSLTADYFSISKQQIITLK